MKCALTIITNAARAGAKMVFLPETSDFITRKSDVMSLTKPLDQNELVLGVKAKAKELGVWVSVGVHESVRRTNQVFFIALIHPAIESWPRERLQLSLGHQLPWGYCIKLSQDTFICGSGPRRLFVNEYACRTWKSKAEYELWRARPPWLVTQSWTLSRLLQANVSPCSVY